MNSISITGRLTADPTKRSAGETEVCDMRVAIPRRKANDGSDRGAVFVDVTAFNGLAKTCGRYLAKGRRIAIQGRLELDEWQAEDNTPRRRHKIVADQVEFLDAPATSSDNGAQATDELAERREATAPAEAVTA